MRLAVAATAIALLSGCPNVANLTTARVLDQGTVEITVAPAVTGISLGIFGGEDTEAITAGTLDLGVRAGIADPVDLGFRVSNAGNFNLDVKIGLLESESLRIALDPTFGGVFFGGRADAGYLQIDAPILVDLVLSDSITFSLAPRYTLLYFFAGDATTPATHLLGGALGVEIALGDSFAIQPNFGIAFWANGPEGVDSTFFTAGVALKWLMGGSRKSGPSEPVAH
jgi:hypothetical protein